MKKPEFFPKFFKKFSSKISSNEMTAIIQRKMLDMFDQKTRKCPDAKDNVKWWHSMEKMRCESESLEKCIPTTIMLED